MQYIRIFISILLLTLFIYWVGGNDFIRSYETAKAVVSCILLSAAATFLIYLVSVILDD
mgnify:CR=1 FL=1